MLLFIKYASKVHSSNCEDMTYLSFSWSTVKYRFSQLNRQALGYGLSITNKIFEYLASWASHIYLPKISWVYTRNLCLPFTRVHIKSLGTTYEQEFHNTWDRACQTSLFLYILRLLEQSLVNESKEWAKMNSTCSLSCSDAHSPADANRCLPSCSEIS